MKRSTFLVIFAGLVAGRAAWAQAQVCAGAEGASTACAAQCSGTVVNDDVPGTPNNGKFNVGGGNQGDGNDGFNNVGNFNIGSGLQGNCLSRNDQLTGSCDPTNNNGQIVLRFCSVYPNDQKCTPANYLAEYTPALITAIQATVAACANGSPIPTLPPVVATPEAAAGPTDTASSPRAAFPPNPWARMWPPMPPKWGLQKKPPTPGIPLAPGSTLYTFTPVSDSKADGNVLGSLLLDKILKDKPFPGLPGRKML